jgi:hypothetical protein
LQTKGRAAVGNCERAPITRDHVGFAAQAGCLVIAAVARVILGGGEARACFRVEHSVQIGGGQLAAANLADGFALPQSLRKSFDRLRFGIVDGGDQRADDGHLIGPAFAHRRLEVGAQPFFQVAGAHAAVAVTR